VTFDLAFQPTTPVGEVRLQYELAPDGTGASAIAECNGTTTLTCTHTLRSGAGIYIIPGAEITYHWEIEDETGERGSTQDQVYVHEDPRFDFKTVSGDNVTVYYYGSDNEAQAVLDAAVEALRSVGALEQAQVTFPVKVFLYETASDMAEAIVPTGSGPGVQTLGEVYYSDTAMVSADVATLDITRHEIAHIVTREATEGPFGVPDWMNEGISVFSQSRMLANQGSALSSAIESDNVLTFKELNSSSAGGSAQTVSLYYAQAGDIVRFLVETYGEEKFGELIQTFKEGSTPDNAYESVYGFDEQGLENEWRASVGLAAAQESPSPTPRATDEAVPPATIESGEGDGDSAADSSSGDDGFPVVTVAIIVALAALAMAALGGLAILIMQRKPNA
jgi:hypothetical protein